MYKSFKEVFPTLQLKKELNEIMDQVEVVKVSSTKNRDFLKIYIKTNHIIQKQFISNHELFL